MTYIYGNSIMLNEPGTQYLSRSNSTHEGGSKSPFYGGFIGLHQRYQSFERRSSYTVIISNEIISDNSRKVTIDNSGNQTIAPVPILDRFKELNACFEREFRRLRTKNTNDIISIFLNFSRFKTNFQNVEFLDSDVDLAEDGSEMKIHLLFKDNVLIVITQPTLGYTQLNENDVQYSLFVDNEIVTSSVIPIDRLAKELSYIRTN